MRRPVAAQEEQNRVAEQGGGEAATAPSAKRLNAFQVMQRLQTNRLWIYYSCKHAVRGPAASGCAYVSADQCATGHRHHAHRIGLTASPACCAQLINAALDISALFDARTDVVARMTRFTSRAAPGVLLARVEEAAHALGGRTRRRDDTRCSPATPMLCLCIQHQRATWVRMSTRLTLKSRTA